MGDRESEISASERVIRALYHIATSSLSFSEKARQLLRLGCERLELEIGILAHIQGQRYEVVEVVAPAGADLHAGDVFELGKTYCSKTLEVKAPIGFGHAAETPFATHPAYREFHLEAYLGVPVQVGGEVYGTVNFSSPAPRRRKFSPVDIDAASLLATWAGRELLRQRTEQELRDAALERDRAERSELVAGIFSVFQHEFNTPLTVALGHLANIEKSADTDQRRALAPVRRSLRRMRDVMGELTGLAGGEPFGKTVVDLAEVAHRALDLVGARREPHFKSDLQTVAVEVVEPRLFQCVHNILLAHIHGGPHDPSSAATSVAVRCGRQGDQAELVLSSGCSQPLGTVHMDLLAALQGRYREGQIPLVLAGRIAEELGGCLDNILQSTGLRTELHLPVAV